MSQRDVGLSQPRSKSLPCNSDGDARPGPIIWSRVWWFILFGATVGAGLDYLHTDGGCIVYPEGTTHSRGILTFAFLYGIVAVLHTIIVNDVLEAPMVTPPPYRHSTLAISVYAALYFVTAYWFTIVPAPLILVMCLCFAFICWRLFDGTWQGLTSSVGVAICGTVVESTLCSNGLMAYVMDDFIGVPMWLPFLYLAGSASYGAMVRRALLVEDHLEPIDNARSSTLYRRM